MDRLRNSRALFNGKGKRYYRPSRYPEIPLSQSDVYVLTQDGDRLDLLANQFYKDVTLYWIIAIANPNIVNMGSLFVTEGSQIRIPVNVQQIVDSYNLLNQ